MEDRRASYQDEAEKNKKSSMRRSLRKLLSPKKIGKLKVPARALKKYRRKHKKNITNGSDNDGDSANTPPSSSKRNMEIEKVDVTMDESSPSADCADTISKQEECAPRVGKLSPDEMNTSESQDPIESDASAPYTSNNENPLTKNSEKSESSSTGSPELNGEQVSDASQKAGAAQSDRSIYSDGNALAEADPQCVVKEDKCDLSPHPLEAQPNDTEHQHVSKDKEENGKASDSDGLMPEASARSLVRFSGSTIERDNKKDEDSEDEEGSLDLDGIPGGKGISNDSENNGISSNADEMKSASSLGEGSAVRFSDFPDDDEGSMGSIDMDDVFSQADDRSESKLSVNSLSNESDIILRRLAQSDVSSHFTDESLYNLLVTQERVSEWLSSFYRTDPRWQIMSFFDDVAREGATNLKRTESEELALLHTSPILKMFARSSVFTVWRPTSLDAIRKMMLREGTGKGLDIKGKSAKKGKLSGYVPFMQIHDNNHKKKVGTVSYGGRIRIFYKTENEREKVVEVLETLSKEMMRKVNTSKLVLQKDPIEVSDSVWETAAENIIWDMEDPSVKRIDLYAPQCYGIEVPERLFWEGYVMRQDCSREPDSEYDTGRPSEPAFQDMNFAAVRKGPQPDKPRAVIWQFDDTDDPMRPTTLLMAYEEKGRVLPVVSDFDAFLVGTRGVRYHDPLPAEQIEIVHWCISQVEAILDKKDEKSWTSQWLRVMKENVQKGARYNVPSLGYGDPKSYAIFDHAKRRLEETNGAVRHAAECFNYGFPQEIDDEFLVISDTLPGNVPWKYVSVPELQDLLCEKIKEGFTFPLHPKWILCDPGWKRVYDQLVASTNTNTQNSLNCWFPPESGLRERIEVIHSKHPNGFYKSRHGSPSMIKSEMDLVEHQLQRYLALMRAKRKLRNIMFWIHFCRTSQRHLRAREEAEKKRKGGSRNVLVVDDDESTGKTENVDD